MANRQRLEELRAIKQNSQAKPSLSEEPRQRLEQLRQMKVAESEPVNDKSFVESAKELITGAERSAALPEDVRDLPELGSVTSPVTTGDFGSDIQIAAGLITSFDPEARKDIIKDAVPDVQFETINDTTVVNLPNGQRAVLNAPGISQSDVISGVAQALAFAGPSKLANFGKGLLQKAGIASGVAGASEAALQGASKALGSEQDIDKGQIALASALAPSGELADPAIKGLKNISKEATKRLEAAGKSALESSDLAKNIKSRLGIRLFPGQQTLSPEMLAEQRVLLTTEEGAKIGIPQLKAQNQEAGKAVEDFLGDIGSSEVIRTSDENFRTISEKVMIEGQKELNALFKQPFKRIQKQIDSQPEKLGKIVDSINDRISVDLSETNNRTAQQALTRFRDELSANRTSIEGIRNAKDEVDLVLDTLGVDSQSAAAVKKARNRIKSAEKQLTAQLGKEFPELRRLNKMFAKKKAEIIGPLERSGFGKFANISDQQLKTLSTKVFDAAETNPKVLEQTKKALKRSKVPGANNAFDDLLRVELDRRILRSKADLDSIINGDDDFVGDLPGILSRGIFGPNQSQRNVLLRALDPKQKKRAIVLEEALKRASAGRIGGSPTQQNQQAMKRIEREPWLRGILSWFKSPISNTLGLGADASRASKRQAAAELAFDPAWGPQFDKINLMKDSAKKAEEVSNLLEKVQAGIIARTALNTAAPVISRSNEGD